MNTLRNSLIALAFVAFGMMSFTMMPTDYNPNPVETETADKNGKWITAGDTLIEGVWYWVKECVAGNVTECLIGSRWHKAKKKEEIIFEL